MLQELFMAVELYKTQLYRLSNIALENYKEIVRPRVWYVHICQFVIHFEGEWRLGPIDENGFILLDISVVYQRGPEWAPKFIVLLRDCLYRRNDVFILI